MSFCSAVYPQETKDRGAIGISKIADITTRGSADDETSLCKASDPATARRQHDDVAVGAQQVTMFATYADNTTIPTMNSGHSVSAHIFHHTVSDTLVA